MNGHKALKHCHPQQCKNETW